MRAEKKFFLVKTKTFQKVPKNGFLACFFFSKICLQQRVIKTGSLWCFNNLVDLEKGQNFGFVFKVVPLLSGKF